MQHIKITFKTPAGEASNMLTALLANAGFEGFEETDDALLAYIPEASFNANDLADIVSATGVPYHMETIPEQNWNAIWESNFEPVIVKDFCTIRAHFHQIESNTPFNILITPKMSFGTGHHATTQQVMILMKDLSFTGRRVLDFGTGTGVLAILAEQLGAHYILAVDNDEWSAENARENVAQNNCAKITVVQGSLEDTPHEAGYDIILANINRNILLQYMHDLYQRLTTGGTLLMSGLLAEDKETMMRATELEGFDYIKGTEQGNWIALEFVKRIN